jgi:hypothetical protein
MALEVIKALNWDKHKNEKVFNWLMESHDTLLIIV